MTLKKNPFIREPTIQLVKLAVCSRPDIGTPKYIILVEITV